jgi:anti-sigma factor RsiW
LDEPGKEEVERASSEEDFGRRQSQRSTQRSPWVVGGLVAALVALNFLLASAYVLKKIPDKACSEQLTGYCKSISISNTGKSRS